MAKKARVTNHAGKGTSKHNFREFPQETKEKSKSDINRDLSYQNKYFLNGVFFDSDADMKEYLSRQLEWFKRQAFRLRDDVRYKDLTISQKYELGCYEKLLGESIKAQHKRNKQNGQECLNRNALDILQSAKTEPEESILQIGNKNYCPVSAEQLWDIYKSYVKLHNAKFGKHIVILNAVLHVDETTLHIHERKAYVGENKHNEARISKNSALKMLGIERPDTNKPQSRYNNPKQTYSAECRNMWIQCCKQYNLDLETVPNEYANKHGLELIEYKVKQEKERLGKTMQEIQEQEKQQVCEDKKLQEIQSRIRSQCSVLEFARKQTKEEVQKKDKIQREKNKLEQELTDLQSKSFWLGQEVAEQEKTISKNALIIKKQNDKIKYYKDSWQEMDIALYVSATVKNEYVDYYDGILTDCWREQEGEYQMTDMEELEL